MAFDNDDVEPGVEEEAGPPPPENNNRTFVTIAAILGAIMLLSLLCVAAYALIILPRQAEERAGGEATRLAQETQVALFAQQTSKAQQPSPTTPPRATNTPAPTNTPVVAVRATNTATPSGEERQATIGAMLTQAAVTAGAVSPTPTGTGELPQSGIFDEWNPALIGGLAFVLVAVIALARRLRAG